MMIINWYGSICSDSVILLLVGVDFVYDWVKEVVRLVGCFCDLLLIFFDFLKYSICICIFSFRNV